jgi:PAS domain S-box
MSSENQCRTDARSEQERLRNLQVFDLDGLDGNSTLKSLTDFAANLCDAPICLVSFVEAERQWFPARTGLSARETARELSFCAHAMRGGDIMIVPDAADDPRFQDNALVTGEPGIRFYAGAPLVSDDGIEFGALCVIDRVPRDNLTQIQREGLLTLGKVIVALLDQRRSHHLQNNRIGEQESRFRILADTMPQMVWSTRPDGYHDYYNARWYEFTGVPEGSTDGAEWNGMFHPDDQARAWSVWQHSLATGDPYEIEYRLRNASGEYCWTLGRALPMRDASGEITRWFGTCTDIHEQKMMQAQREIISQELSHRIKNIFSVVNGLISFSARQHPELEEVTSDLRERILALGRAHDFVRPHSKQSRPRMRANSLAGMLNDLLAAYAERVTIDGEEVIIDDRSATPLALTFHELATNAAKYGALAVPDGSVSITCAMTDQQHVRLEWTEHGGRTALEPSEYGFGSKLIELSVTRQMGGTIERTWGPQGLRVELNIPYASMVRRS